MVAVSRDSRFVQTVRRELAGQELSIRALARRIDPANLNRARRNLHRWLDEGIVPSPSSRAAVAHALNVPVEELADDDDEEADPAMREAFVLFADLMGRLQNRPVRDGAQA